MDSQKLCGLSEQEVAIRTQAGKINTTQQKISKSYQQIFFDNVFSFFNLINVVLLILVFSVGSFKNALFGFTIIINTSIGIYQEVKAKRILDRLTLIVNNEVAVIRNGKVSKIAAEKIVIDDLMQLETGDQVLTDAVVISGEAEVNESMLTGEADDILKKESDQVLSGSFIITGKVICRVTSVGEDNWAQKITNEVKVFRKHRSELSRNLDRILKLISVFVVPAGIMLFLKQMYVIRLGYSDAILDTVTAVLGMIPEGLILLASTALIIGVMRLAKMQTLVQELTCIETLARVDVLCLDKTGTITDGMIKFSDIIKLKKFDDKEVLGNLLHNMEESNMTMEALKEVYQIDESSYVVKGVLPFSSKRKYCGISFKSKGCYFLGARQFLFPDGHPLLDDLCEKEASQGRRILVLGHSRKSSLDIIADIEPLAVILLVENIREDAHETLEYFKNQGVELKIISGDDAITVSAIATRAGLENAESYVNASTLKEDNIAEAAKNYTVFGRVTPHQKKQLVIALKKQGRTVAMVGDGVNDVLAFKEADCSVAMISGCDVAKRVANIVLLDNNFSAMPSIVNEGRRVINNISTASSMYLIKTFFSVFLTIGTLLVSMSYPFEPIQLTLISSCCVGIPTFFLTYESSFEKTGENFVRNILTNALPFSLVIAFSSIFVQWFGSVLVIPEALLQSVCVLITGWIYLLALSRIYTPLTKYRKLVIYSMQVIYYFAIFQFRGFFGMVPVMSTKTVVVMLMIIVFVPFLLDVASYLLVWINAIMTKQSDSNK